MVLWYIKLSGSLLQSTYHICMSRKWQILEIGCYSRVLSLHWSLERLRYNNWATSLYLPHLGHLKLALFAVSGGFRGQLRSRTGTIKINSLYRNDPCSCFQLFMVTAIYSTTFIIGGYMDHETSCYAWAQARWHCGYSSSLSLSRHIWRPEVIRSQ